MRTLSVIFKHGDYLVHDLDRRMASALRLPDLLRVAAALGNKVLDVEHLVRYLYIDLIVT